MQHETFAKDGACGRDERERDRLNAVILYDTAEAGRRAMSQLRQATLGLAEDVEFQVRLWRLDLVGDAATASSAIADLATAELVVLAVDQVASLKDRVRDRLREAVHAMRVQGAALAILTNEPAGGASPQFDFLQHAAEEAGVGFVFPTASRAPAGTDSSLAASDYRASATTPMHRGNSQGTSSRRPWDHTA